MELAAALFASVTQAPTHGGSCGLIARGNGGGVCGITTVLHCLMSVTCRTLYEILVLIETRMDRPSTTGGAVGVILEQKNK